VKLGDYPVTAGAKADGYATAGTKADCSAEATATFNPPEIVGEVGGRAFAGARAGTHAKVGVGPFALDVGIDARAGAGIEGGGAFSFKDGKFEFHGFAGVAAAVGLGTTINFSIDFNQIGQMVAGIFGGVAASSPPGSPGQAAAAGISDFVKAATPFAAKALDQYATTDLLHGDGKYKEDATATTKRDDASMAGLSSAERDAVREQDMRRMSKHLSSDLDSLGQNRRA
jgi:hypothetical protein